MSYKICIPGGGPAVDVGAYPDIAAAVEARDRLWGTTTWGGQSLVLVDEESGAVVRPCLWCRGRGLEGAERCGHCGGAGIDADSPEHPANAV